MRLHGGAWHGRAAWPAGKTKSCRQACCRCRCTAIPQPLYCLHPPGGNMMKFRCPLRSSWICSSLGSNAKQRSVKASGKALQGSRGGEGHRVGGTDDVCRMGRHAPVEMLALGK